MARNGSLDGLRGAQEYLRSTNIFMSLSGAEKLHNGMGFEAKRKNKTNFVSAANKKLRLAWALKHRQLTVSDWRKWVLSGKPRVNMGAQILNPSIGQMCLVPTDFIKFDPKCKVLVMGLCFGAAYQAIRRLTWL
ncbi:hypothetical protein INT46_000931 [Mucor plumbeus]|uniref:Transposase Tc1-like domain-containing protein n=1 Tax=Mucor plumbeus TaxID=97098 RepID=A0A8H7RPB6_9FUNG|nr:hypothetical protein INT46_000931 [Mucor plumbeus]